MATVTYVHINTYSVWKLKHKYRLYYVKLRINSYLSMHKNYYAFQNDMLPCPVRQGIMRLGWWNTVRSKFYKKKKCFFKIPFIHTCRSQWPRGLRRRSAAARLLRSWVRIPPAAWIFVCCERRVLSGRGLCDELITRPEESYRLWCVMYDLETSRICAPYIYDISSLRVKHQI